MAAIGSTRNLTAQFVRYRNEAKRARGPDAYGGGEDRCASAAGSLLSRELHPPALHSAPQHCHRGCHLPTRTTVRLRSFLVPRWDLATWNSVA
jgi:hypothetical protein